MYCGLFFFFFLFLSISLSAGSSCDVLLTNSKHMTFEAIYRKHNAKRGFILGVYFGH